MSTSNCELLVTVDEAARRLSVGRTFLYGLVMRGEIASLKLGRGRRIPVAALVRFVHEELEAQSPLEATDVATSAKGENRPTEEISTV